MRIAVLGGGNGAHALAGDLALAGLDVTLSELPDFSVNIAVAQALGGIYVSGNPVLGKAPGFARLRATTNIRESVQNADLVWLVVPAFAQDAFFDECIPVLRDGQVVVLMPGKFGALALKCRLSNERPGVRAIVCETESLLYATRLRGPGSPWIKASKASVKLAALPSRDTAAALEAVNELFPGRFAAAGNVLETSLYAPGIIMHPVSTLMNASRIEQMGPYKNSYYDVTPGVANVMERLDEERKRVGAALGLEVGGLAETLGRFYGAQATDVYTAIHTARPYATQTSPDSLQHRYITEDVPFGLVPVSELGRAVGEPTPGCDAVIQLASMANGVDYRREGRTLQKMGLESLAGNRAALAEFLAG